VNRDDKKAEQAIGQLVKWVILDESHGSWPHRSKYVDPYLCVAIHHTSN